MFSRENAERAMERLMSAPNKLARARSALSLAESSVKRIKAIVMGKFRHLSLSAQEREAYASHEYYKATVEVAEAMAAYELLRAECDADRALLEGWRTAESTSRTLMRV
jgi:predicted transcriptional regulator of viral defense system